MQKEHRRRLQSARQLMQAHGYSCLVLASAGNIQYFTGVLEPSIHTCGVVVLPKEEDPVLAVMWLDRDAAEQEVSGIDIVPYGLPTQGKVITGLVKKLAKPDCIGMDNHAVQVLGGAFKRSLPSMTVTNIDAYIEGAVRSVKSPEEIGLVRKSCRIAVAGIEAAIEAVRPGISELEVASAAAHRMISLGSNALRHNIVVASGYRSQLPHAFATPKKIEKDDLVSIDLGAAYRNYCSDIARTVFVGDASKQLKEAAAVLARTQAATLKRIVPGVPIEEIQAFPREFMKSEGFSPVGHTGHSIGLQIEEHPFLIGSADPDPNRVIRKNQVYALFQGSIRNNGVPSLGIRIEDTLLVTETGTEVLTEFPRELL